MTQSTSNHRIPSWKRTNVRHTFKLVYYWCMARTNIDLDDVNCEVVMRRYNLTSKKDAVNLALRLVASEGLSPQQARALRGAGWEGDLQALRASRHS